VLASDLSPLADFVVKNPSLALMGLMCVPPVAAEVEESFAKIQMEHLRFLRGYPQAIYLSAGMSSDFESAIKHGATHIRVGSEILGSRSYPQ
jgi:uncharacterized pyridoxal phosphate-containing UPF0001 family protein